jgi:hypothetical protein
MPKAFFEQIDCFINLLEALSLIRQLRKNLTLLISPIYHLTPVICLLSSVICYLTSVI